MLITRKTKVPYTWAFFAQLTIILSIYGAFVVNAPFLLLIKKFIDNPAAIMGLVSLQIYVTFIVGPLVAWTSDRIWTRFGRRKFLVGSADLLKGLFLIGMPFAPNLWTLIILRWLYDFFGDLAAPAQAMIYEVVPSKQRGMSGGFMKAFMSVGNLIFFFLLLGRFHDAYFMGPFQFFSTPSGGTLMFILCAVLFIGAAVFEFIGIKEIYPVGRKRLLDGRKPGEKLFKHFVRSVFKDVLAKDLLPLYLLLFANIMFGFSLGVFQPLLFTEQWGYSLQEFGNNIAIGVPFAIVLGLLGGWMSDRFGKMQIVLWATVINLLVNIIYTVFVYLQPDYTPRFWEIVIFGNIINIFATIKGVASGPLLWEFVARNRMGAATAGIQLFNVLFRNSVGVLVGLWLLVWSIWFFPQAGYNLTVHFQEELSREEVAARTAAAGLDAETLVLRPMHQPRVDGERSRRWWIHQEDKEADAWIKERTDLQNDISSLEGKLNSIFTDEAKKPDITEAIASHKNRIAELEQLLMARSEGLAERLAPVLADVRFAPGRQLLAASWEGDRLILEARTLEPLSEADVPLAVGNLQGQEFASEWERDEQGISRRRLDVRITPQTQADKGVHSVRLEARLDAGFVSVFNLSLEAGFAPQEAFDFATAVGAINDSLFSSINARYELVESQWVAPASEDTATGGQLVFSIRPRDFEPDTALRPQEVEAVYQDTHRMVSDVSVSSTETGYQVRLDLERPSAAAPVTLAYDEVGPAIAEALGNNGADAVLATVIFRKLAETLAARPLYLTVPRHAAEPSYTEREYEYFFSSQILQIATDVFGIGILIFIVVLEKRGTLHRYGAEEDDNR